MYNSSNVFTAKLIYLILGFCFTHAQLSARTQDSIQPSITLLLKTANSLHSTKQYKELLAYVNKHIQKVEPQTATDSLDVADLYFHQFQGNYYTGNYPESLKSVTQGLSFCQDQTSDRANHLRGVLYYKKAYSEQKLNFAKRAEANMKTAIDFLTESYPPSLDYLVDAYVFLSSQAAYHGHIEDAKRYIRLATRTYKNHQTYLDKARVDRYEVVLAYRKAYILYKLAKTREDSLEITKTVQKLHSLHQSPAFNKAEQIYYTTALNHIGDWYISHTHDSLISSKDLEIGSQYLDTSINLVENAHYIGNLTTFKFNKCKALTLANELPEAEQLISDLLEKLAPNDHRKSFFLAQKALIKAKLQQKDSALYVFHQVIEQIHTDTTALAKNYENFKPSKVYGESKLIYRVAEKLTKFYSDDPLVQKRILKLYQIAFVQFENSYVQTKYNTNQDQLLRTIMQGLLTSVEKYSDKNSFPIADILGRTETMMNQLTWRRFYHNRFTNSLPRLDSLKFRHLSLRTSLTVAKRNHNIRAVDSVQQLITQHERYTENAFPNLALLSTQQFDLSALQEKLHDDEMILKYFILNQQIALFHITAKSIRWELRPWTAQEIALTTKFIENIRNRKFDTNNASKLGYKLVPKLDTHYTKIIINPDGELYQIPFEALQHKNEFLVENFHIRYTSNLGFIYPNYLQNHPKNQEVAIYAPSYLQKNTAVATRNATRETFLQGAQKEAEIISQLFPSKMYTGTEVSKKFFLRTAPEASILHLAMHAEMNADQSGLSRLIFSKHAADDEDLYLEELYAVQLNANLAVLSACNTGLGKESAARNVESFQRAFTFSGVPATVVSLWEVPDQSTSEIMSYFYTHLKNGDPKSEALKKAKITYLNTHQGTKLAEPYYWTGFILYGDETAIVEKSTSVVWYILLIAIIFIIAVLLRRNRRQNNTRV